MVTKIVRVRRSWSRELKCRVIANVENMCAQLVIYMRDKLRQQVAGFGPYYGHTVLKWQNIRNNGFHVWTAARAYDRGTTSSRFIVDTIDSKLRMLWQTCNATTPSAESWIQRACDALAKDSLHSRYHHHAKRAD